VTTTPDSKDTVKKVLDENDVDFIFASFTEVRGKSSAKLVPAAQLDNLFSSGAGFAGYAAGGIG
jgi:glutamine synthetase